MHRLCYLWTLRCWGWCASSSDTRRSSLGSEWPPLEAGRRRSPRSVAEDGHENGIKCVSVQVGFFFFVCVCQNVYNAFKTEVSNSRPRGHKRPAKWSFAASYMTSKFNVSAAAMFFCCVIAPGVVANLQLVEFENSGLFHVHTFNYCFNVFIYTSHLLTKYNIHVWK